MSNIYENGSYLKSNPTWHEENSSFKAIWISAMLKKHNIVPEKICEVGCGAGGIIECISKEFIYAECFGYDISPQAIEIAQKKQNDNLHFSNSDLLQETKSFNCILCMDVFEHIEDYFNFLRNLKTKAKHFIFHIPLDMNVQKIIRSGRLLKDRIDVGHIHYFNKETALATLKDCGYSVIDFCYTDNADLPNNKAPKIINSIRKFLFRFWKDKVVVVGGGYSLLVLAE